MQQSVAASEFQLIPIDQVEESPSNPRKSFDVAQLDELTASVKSHGVLQPIVVRRVGKRYEIVAGARRYRASVAAELATIPAMVHVMSDEQALEVMIIENAKRSDVHPLEEAHAFHELQHKYKHDVASIAARVGRSVAYVYDRMRLLQLTKKAQKCFLDGKFTAGHAVILARLKPDEQELAMDPNQRALFEHEHTLFDPSQKHGESPYKARTTRELQAWVDKNCKLDPAAEDVPQLFPELAQAVDEAQEEAEKVVQLTHEYHLPPQMRDGPKIYGPQSWREAKKPCAHAVTGVIVVGAGRGRAMQVCLEKKKCSKHWSKEIKAAKQRAEAGSSKTDGESSYSAQQKKYEEQRAKDEAERNRWKAATPALIEAINNRVNLMPVSATGDLADFLVEHCQDYRGAKSETLPRGSSADDLVRHLASMILVGDVSDSWSAYRDFPKTAKRLGIDVKKVLDKSAPVDGEEKKTSSKRKSKKAKDDLA